MAQNSGRLALVFSCLGHAYMHLFTAFYFVIVLALERDWSLPYHELIALWTLGSLMVGLAALPAGWLADRWSAVGMMVVFFVGLGLSGIVCGLVDGPTALFLGLTSIGVFSAIYHPVGIAWLVRNATARGKALGINGIFGSLGIASAGLVAGALIDLFGWRAAFILPGLVSLAT
ncbi:MAG TPA: MFS transporter, partial [Kiloniellales bacterium]|nr:MFS transporter [Kiloniellales bacterium]